jgi:hypothetical protein
VTEEQANALAQRLIAWLETGDVPEGLFAADVFCDFTPPLWRLQAQGIADVVALRRNGHPSPGKVVSWRCDPTPNGFVLEVEERWVDDGRAWYCRELLRADVIGAQISAISVYCTGDWTPERCTQHAREVRLIRP